MNKEQDLLNIIKECLKRGIPVSLNMHDDRMYYIVPGFSKSGTVRVSLDGYDIQCEARYNEVTTIDTFRDLALVAYDWYTRYKDRSVFENPDPLWVATFIEFNWLKKHTETVTTYKPIMG